MRLVKALVGGVIGAAIGAALIVGVQGYLLIEAPWLALVVGVLTGLGVRFLGKTDKPGPCYLCGAIAAGLTLAAFVGATLATTEMLQAQVAKNEIKLSRDRLPDEMVNAPPVMPQEDDAADDADDDAADDAALAPVEEPATEDEPAVETPAGEPVADETATEVPAVEEESAEEDVVEEESDADTLAEPINVPRVVGASKPPLRGEEFSILSFVLIGVGALIAYELGRNSGGKPVA